MKMVSAFHDLPNYYELVGNLRTGNRLSRTLLTGTEGAPDNYKLNYGGGGDTETTPRHRHDYEQIRYPLSGDYVIAKDQVLPAGWVAYFPESVYYGPQVKSVNLMMLSLQFGGPSGLGYWSVEQRKRAFKALVAKGGKFENGIYTWLDEKGQRHNQDAAEAVVEEAFGRRIRYPEPRYKNLVMMNPEAYSWTNDRNRSGVARKTLGSFTERDVRVGFIRLEKGATLPFGLEKSPEILFLKEGAIADGEQRYGRLSAFSTATEDQPVALKALEPTELFYIKLPTF